MSILEVEHIRTAFGDQIVHDDISFSLEPATINALIGGSGSGKTTMLKIILGLQKPTSGAVKLFGQDFLHLSDKKMQPLRNRYGILFQNGALFSALSVGENIAVPMREQTKLTDESIRELVALRLSLVGLAPEDAKKMPSDLSGGMRKRVGLARALALEPDILFLDEPTSGLDPVNARVFDELIQTLTDSLKLTVLMITHDLESIRSISDRVLILADGKLIADGPLEKVTKVNHPWIQSYFSVQKAA